MKYIVHRGIKLPLVGVGTYRMGEDNSLKNKEVDAICYAVSRYEMTLIDTAEMYADGESEKVVAQAIKGYDRKKLFIVDKILPENAEKNLYESCCRQSLKRLETDYIDLYLLHWRSNVDLQKMVDEMEKLKSAGLIKEWGVSNFDCDDMSELLSCKNGKNCFANQVMFNVCNRGIEYDLIPFCKKSDVLIMAYAPIGHKDSERLLISENEAIKRLSQSEDKTPESLMLSFTIINDNVISIFKSTERNHIDNDMKNVFEPLKQETLDIINSVFPPPYKKIPLEKR